MVRNFREKARYCKGYSAIAVVYLMVLVSFCLLSSSVQSANPPIIKLPGAPGVFKTTPAPLAPSFQPCFVNSFAYAAMGPCGGRPGTKITIKVLRQIQNPIIYIAFKPRTGGQAGGTGSQILNKVTGNGTAVGSVYTLDAPRQLCMLGNGSSWDAWPIDSRNKTLGNIGTFRITCP
jgi:hypothetical protein